MLLSIIKSLFHECSENLKICSPRKFKFPSGNKISVRGNELSCFPTHRAINV